MYSFLCSDLVTKCLEYLEFNDIWNIRICCRLFYHVYCTGKYQIVIPHLNDESIMQYTLKLIYYAYDTQIYDTLTYMYTYMPQILQYKREEVYGLYQNRCIALIDQCIPIYKSISHQICIDSYTLDTSYTPLVQHFISNIYDLSYIHGKVIVSSCIYPTLIADKLIQISQVKELHIQCSTSTLLSLLIHMMNTHMYQRSIKSISFVYTNGCNHGYDMINQLVKIVFPSLVHLDIHQINE